MKNFDFSDVICIILARGGSKGLKKKNLRKLRGYPLISYPIMHAKKSGVIGTILVSTDDKDIAKIAKKYGAEVPFLRPKKLAKDLSTTEEGLKHALISYEKIKKKKFSIGVFITATDIFRKVNWITFAVKKLKSKFEFIKKRPGEPDCTFADITKIQKYLKWHPKINIEEGVKKLINEIKYWENAPVWTPDSIKEATKDWFKFLG